MKNRTRLIASVLSAAVLLPLRGAVAQQQPGPDSPLPIDPQVRVGEFDNGLRYYIRANARPEQRAELRLVVNAGSILEDEDQRGLAHFVEHMAFNGTAHFARQELVHYLESIGMRFGPDVNAYTGFDETVYMLTIPTDSAAIVATAFRILEEWATNITFEPEEIDRERGVVIEEWRGGRGAQSRLMERQVPAMLGGSRYAARLPIGRRETLETFPHEALTRFYDRWYRPDLMAVIAVGDFDPAAIEALIRRHFASIPRPATPADRPSYAVPTHGETLFHTTADPELTVSRVEVLHKQPPRSVTTLGDYRQALVEGAFTGLLNARLGEITQKPDAPFLAGFAGRGAVVRPASVFTLGAVVPDGGVETGMLAVLTEAERVARHGFTATELARYTLNMQRAYERAWAEREHTNSAAFANAYASHFLNGTPITGIEFEARAAEQLLPGITLAEVDRLAREWITEANRVVMVSAPAKAGVVLPDAAALRRVLAAAATAEVGPYEDTVNDAPLVATPPPPGAIVEDTLHASVDMRELRLANGVRVLLKQTDFRDDEIVLRAYSPGGLSLAPDDAYVSATFAADVVGASGVGSFSVVELQRALAGKAVGVQPTLGEFEQGFAGTASPRDMETLLQLVYLYFTAPRLDEFAVRAMTDRVRAALVNRSMNPGLAFADTLQVTLTQNHPRARPPTPALLDRLDVAAAHAFFRDRFADANGFTFVLVGNLDMETLLPLIRTYLGGLPSAGRTEQWRDTGVRSPTGVVEKVVRHGLEQRASTRIVFTGPFEYSRESSHLLRSLADVLTMRLREVLREDLGGTYGVQVSAGGTPRPEPGYAVTVSFGASPERLDELVGSMFEEIRRIAADGPRPEELARVREIQRRERETSLRQNGFWAGQIVAYDRENVDFGAILTYGQLIEGLTATTIRAAARAVLRSDNYVRVSLFPAATP